MKISSSSSEIQSPFKLSSCIKINYFPLPPKLECRLIKILLHNDHYYTDYFSALDALKSGNQRVHFLISLCRNILLFGALYIGQFYFTQDRLSSTENIAAYNVVYLNDFEAPWNLVIAIFILYARYLFTLMYCKNTGPSSRLLYELVVLGDGKFFQGGKYYNRKKRKSAEVKKEKKLVEKIQLTAVLLQSAFQIAYACNCKVLICFLK